MSLTTFWGAHGPHCAQIIGEVIHYFCREDQTPGVQLYVNTTTIRTGLRLCEIDYQFRWRGGNATYLSNTFFLSLANESNSDSTLVGFRIDRQNDNPLARDPKNPIFYSSPYAGRYDHSDAGRALLAARLRLSTREGLVAIAVDTGQFYRDKETGNLFKVEESTPVNKILIV